MHEQPHATQPFVIKRVRAAARRCVWKLYKMKQQRRLKLSGIQVGITGEYLVAAELLAAASEIGDSTLLDGAYEYRVSRGRSCREQLAGAAGRPPLRIDRRIGHAICLRCIVHHVSRNSAQATVRIWPNKMHFRRPTID